MTVCTKNKFLVTLLALFVCANLWGQTSNFTKSDHWKNLQKELIFGIGASNFLGDLGGLNRRGSHFSPLDMEWNTTRPSGHIGFRFRLGQFIATKTFLQYAVLKGDDALTNEPYRRNRNLSFRTHLFEFGQQVELIFLTDESFGARHKIQGLKGLKAKNTVGYVFSGITGFGYIPQGTRDGGWTNLRPLKTEGQGLEGGSDPYGFFSVGIPIGIGFKVGLDAVWRISFELSYTQTFTDYLDDVGGVYYDNAAIESSYGSTSAYFADPSTGAFPSWTAPGELRGDSAHDDGYIFMNISFVRNVSLKKGSRIKWKYRRW